MAGYTQHPIHASICSIQQQQQQQQQQRSCSSCLVFATPLQRQLNPQLECLEGFPMKLTPLGTEKEGFSAVYRVYLSEPQKLSISCLKRGPPYNSDSDNGIYMIEYVMDCIGETEGVLMMNYSTNQEDLLDSEKYKINTTTTTSTNSIGKPLDVMFMQQQQQEEKSNQNLYYRLTVDKSTGVLLAIRLKSMQAEAAAAGMEKVEKSYYYTHETVRMLSSHSLVTTTT
jgi:hypothetical protein